jgi:hypothetical protein
VRGELRFLLNCQGELVFLRPLGLFLPAVLASKAGLVLALTWAAPAAGGVAVAGVVAAALTDDDGGLSLAAAVAAAALARMERLLPAVLPATAGLVLALP